MAEVYLWFQHSDEPIRLGMSGEVAEELFSDFTSCSRRKVTYPTHEGYVSVDLSHLRLIREINETETDELSAGLLSKIEQAVKDAVLSQLEPKPDYAAEIRGHVIRPIGSLPSESKAL